MMEEKEEIIDRSGDFIRLVYNHITKTYNLTCSPWYKNLPKDAGFQFDSKKTVWRTKDLFTAVKLVAYADSQTRDYLNQEWQKASHSYNLSMQTDCDISIPAPKGKEYLPYQKVGIRYCLSQDGSLIGDDMGLGKTIQGIGVINYLSNVMKETPIKKVLIVCPASLKQNWRKEIHSWLVGKLTYAIATSKFFPRNFDIIIINYDILHKWIVEINSVEWDLIISDESQKIKNPASRMSKNFYTINAKKKIFLTGTPIERLVTDIFPMIHYLNPTAFPSKTAFNYRYLSDDGKSGKNLEELQQKLRATVMIRRLKKDVLKDLPDKVRQIIQLPTPPYAKALIESENAIYSSKEYLLEEAQNAISRARAANDVEQYKRAVAMFQNTTGSILAELSKKRVEIAMAKAPLILEVIKDTISKEHKIILFCHHHEVMDYFKENLESVAVKFSGKESLDARNTAVEQFQTNDKTQVFVGSIHAAGVGITLTASSHVIFAELDWLPTKLQQAEDRAHRIGQKDSVLVQHYVLEGSLDLRIAERLIARQEMIEKALNEAPKTFSSQGTSLGNN